MWSDKETVVDLLGFTVHKNLIRQLVTDSSLLPLTVGVFGDWGGGKSSILRMLEKDLNQEKDYPDIACLYFNGWMFEGYDDAKAALITSVLLQLGEHKRFGPKIRDRVVPMLKRTDFMRLLPFLMKHGAVPLTGAALAAGGVALGMDPHAALAGLPFLAGLGSTARALAAAAGADSLDKSAGGTTIVSTGQAAASGGKPVEGLAINWLDLVSRDKTTPSVLDVRTFQRDFERLLAETDLRALVVLIDDLDRCMPDRLVENLEAIRLFLAVPKTAFVIAADERIVRHAVSTRYVDQRLRDEQSGDQEPYDLVTDYIEKLIQVPYHLPRLSPSEIETYMTLLFCQLHLKEKEQFPKILTHCEAARKRNLYITYGAGAVKEALGGTLPDDLGTQLQWVSSVASAFTEGLKGNPRQVKRFLNALVLRRQLADVASLSIRDDVLVKLMLLEYTRSTLFDQVYGWQARSEGRPPELKRLEEQARSVEAAPDAQSTSHVPLPDGLSPRWAEPAVQDWLRLDPALTDVDLRDYFWIARDKLKTMVSGLTMLSPLVRKLFEGLLSVNLGERQLSAKSVKDLDQHELAELLHLLDQQVERQVNGRIGVDALLALTDVAVPGAVDTLLAALSALPVSNLDPSLAFELQRLASEKKAKLESVQPLLERWASTHTRIGAAAQSALDDMSTRKGVKN